MLLKVHNEELWFMFLTLCLSVTENVMTGNVQHLEVFNLLGTFLGFKFPVSYFHFENSFHCMTACDVYELVSECFNIYIQTQNTLLNQIVNGLM